MRLSLRTLSSAATVLLGSGGLVGLSQAAELATVISSTPVHSTVVVPRQVCTDSQTLVQSRPSGAGAVVGAIAGGVIGNALGEGAGRAAATGLGAVAGAIVGDQVEAGSNAPAAMAVRRCQTVNQHDSRIVGYDVVYEYGGQRYSSRLSRDPGATLSVSVQPAVGGGAGVPVPPYADTLPLSGPATSVVATTSEPTVTYVETQPRTVYYDALPPSYLLGPVIGFGLGYYGGYYGGGYRGYRGHYWH
jgi:uncharacterized protein YcfJ